MPADDGRNATDHAKTHEAKDSQHETPNSQLTSLCYLQRFVHDVPFHLYLFISTFEFSGTLASAEANGYEFHSLQLSSSFECFETRLTIPQTISTGAAKKKGRNIIAIELVEPVEKKRI